MSAFPGYVAPWPLSNRHFNTIYGARIAPAPRVGYRRERWDTPDGDFVDVDFVDGAAEAPFVLLFHGLEGSSRSSYARGVMAAARSRGWRGAVVNFRGCSGEPNRRPRAYHSGDSTEADWILRKIHARLGGAPLHVVGVSLGGNVLAKWLGEQGEAGRMVRRAVVVCGALDLHVIAAALERGFCRVYTWAFLRTLRRSALERLVRFPGLYDPAAVRAAGTLRAFDDAVTAPLHGFRDAEDYWTRSSSRPLLRNVRVPLLLINPLDDPFYPAHELPRADELSDTIVVDRPATGGHVGFSTLRGDWLARRVVAFLDDR
jgi:predicted alpha/beta-fold hydrolase